MICNMSCTSVRIKTGIKLESVGYVSATEVEISGTVN